MVSIARNNHYVPQLYLRNWSAAPEKVWRYRLLVSHDNVPLWDHTSIVSTGSFNDLYTYSDGDSESDEFEQWFNTEIEIPANKVIAKVVNNEILSKNDFNVLSKFVAAQLVRTPARLHKQLGFYKNELSATIDDALARAVKKLEMKIEKGESIKEDNEVDAARYIPTKVTISKNPDNEEAWIKYETILGRGVWLYEIRHIVDKTSRVLLNHHWQIIKAAPGAKWCTSDDPVICLNYCGLNNYDFGGGWNRHNSEIILPLSPKHILYTKVGSSTDDKILQENPFYTFLFQKLIIEHAYRNIFSYSAFESISKYRQRVVNSDIFNFEKDAWTKWYAEQTEAELALKNKQ
ncbi:MAG: DUF4238 domain-containing protein [Eubacteriales bacterium]|nr:DUF4238 domain-containing protein [Eubacteriales bacterium]